MKNVFKNCAKKENDQYKLTFFKENQNVKCYNGNKAKRRFEDIGGTKMANTRLTRDALAKSLKELLKERPLEKISVKDITEHCNMSRNNFYYHFKDKYELISWIFYNDISKRVATYEDSSKFLEDSFSSVCECLYNEREFYLKCFKYVEQNSLFEVLTELYMDLWRKTLTERYANSGIQLEKEEIELMAKMNTRAMVVMITDWVRRGMKDDYMNYSEENASSLDRECYVVGGKYVMLS